jgi:general secretion pathway protein G
MLSSLKKRLRNEKGFTLIELMVVVVIIGLLVAIILPQFFSQADKARVAKAKADIQSIKSAVELWASDPAGGNGRYPTTTQIGTVLSNLGINTTNLANPWGSRYVYAVNNDTNPKQYMIISKGQDLAYGGNDDIVATEKSSPTSGANVTIPQGWTSTDI